MRLYPNSKGIFDGRQAVTNYERDFKIFWTMQTKCMESASQTYSAMQCFFYFNCLLIINFRGSLHPLDGQFEL